MFDVSVLMFTYRPEGSKRVGYIQKSLASLRSQELLKIQAIVLDDGSAHPLPPEWVKSTANVDIQYQYYSENRGKHKMMDIGLPLLKAPLMTTLHDDDYYPGPRSLLTRFQGFLEPGITRPAVENIDPSVAMVFTNAIYEDEVLGKRYELYPKDKVIVHSHEALLNKCYICGAAYMIRTEFKQRFRSHPSLKHAEEVFVWCAVSRHAHYNNLKFKYLSDITAVYRMHREQTWHSVRTNPSIRKTYLPFIREQNKL